jgi:hypothetical protein
MPDELEHPADLPVAALREDHAKPRVAFGPWPVVEMRSIVDGSVRRPSIAIPRRSRPRSLSLGCPETLTRYSLGTSRGRVGQIAREIAVVGQDQQTLGLHIEPPHRLDLAAQAARSRSSTVSRLCGSETVVT